MSGLRVETVHGRHLLCGGLIDNKHIKHGQAWAPASGGNYTVTISGVRDEWVGYTWLENGVRKYHEKSAFAFQCRYCLVLETSEIPKELL